MFSPGQAHLALFIKYLSLLHTLIMMSGPYQSNKLSVLDDDDGSVSPNAAQDILRN